MILYIYPGLIWLGLLLSIPAYYTVDAQYKKHHRVIFCIILMIAILETYGAYTLSISKSNNIFHNLFWVYGETLLLLYFFYLNLKGKKIRFVIILAGSLFFLWAGVNSIFFQPLSLFQIGSFIPASLMLIGFCIYYFGLILKEELYEGMDLIGIPTFWIVTMVMFFYSSSFLFFAATPLVNAQNYPLMIKAYSLIRSMSVLLYLTMGLAYYAPLIFISSRTVNKNN